MSLKLSRHQLLAVRKRYRSCRGTARKPAEHPDVVWTVGGYASHDTCDRTSP